MSSIRGRVALAAVAATAAAVLLVGIVVVATFVWDVRTGPDADLHRRAGTVAGSTEPGVEGPRDVMARRFGEERAMGAGRALGRRLLVVGLGALALVGASSWAVSGLALRPLRDLQRAAERVATTRDLQTRLPEGDAAREVAAVASSLNAMLARLEASAGRTEAALEANRRFAGDAGHELRTPLTSMTANLEVLARPDGLDADERARVLAETRWEAARLVTLIDALQALARGESSSIRREPLDLADVVDAAVASARTRHPEARVRFDDPGAVPVTGWPEGLRLAVDNLVENALRHGGRAVAVAVAAGDGVARVVVDDDGPGIPAMDRERVLGRFARGTTEAPGSGLGLALVAQQAALHGGGVAIADGPLGGARVTLALSAT